MKKKELETTSLEKRKVGGVGTLATAALVGALSLLSPMEGSAKSASSIDDGAKVTEVTLPGTEVEEEKDTISFGDSLRDDGTGSEVDEETLPGVEPDPEGDGEISVDGFIQVGTSVVPDFANIFSDKISGMIAIDAKHQKTGLGLTVIRLDDFHTGSKYPLSRASVVVPYRNVSSKDGKRSAGTSLELSFIDQMPGKVGFTPVVVGTYNADGWTFEGKYFHNFKEGEDMDSVRLGISRKIGDIMKLTAQGWYKSDYAGKFYGRIIADVDLGDGFGVQLSCILRDGKITPTGGIMYKF